MRRRAKAANILLAIAVAASLRCGGSGGGGGGGGPTGPATPTPIAAITFTPSGTGGANSLTLTRVSSNQSSIVLSLEATSITELYGVAFDLRFPAGALAFDRVTEGTYLDQNGSVDTSLQVTEMPSGTLVVGLTRLGQVGGRTGTGSLLQIEFDRRAAGSGDLVFAENQAFNPLGQIPGVQWSAGRVVVP